MNRAAKVKLTRCRLKLDVEGPGSLADSFWLLESEFLLFDGQHSYNSLDHSVVGLRKEKLQACNIFRSAANRNPIRK